MEPNRPQLCLMKPRFQRPDTALGVTAEELRRNVLSGRRFFADFFRLLMA
jgi:hypothetical protein